MTSLTNHSQSVIYSHPLSSTSYWQCLLHTILSFAHNTFCILISYHILYLFFVIAAHVIMFYCLHIPPPSRTVMLILIFNSTAYCHAHSLILYILYSVLYILLFIVVFYNICTVHGADLIHISLLVIQSLYSRVCDIKTWNLKLQQGYSLLSL